MGWIKLGVLAHAINLRGRWEDQMLPIFNRGAHDGEIGFKVEFKNAQGLLHIGSGSSNCNQGQNDIALTNMELNPFAIDGNVAFNKVEAWMLGERSQVLLVEVHAVDLKAVVLQETLGKVTADEAVDTQDQHLGGLLLA